MQTWRLINTEDHSGFINMAIDEAIVMASQEGKVPPTLRFYTWSPECISIGYFQKYDRLSADLNLDSMKRDIVRRVTGGRAVLHGNDLSYSLVCHTDDRIFGTNIRETYHIIANVFIVCLKRLGIAPDPIHIDDNRIRRQKYQDSTFCFATTLGHEISVKGKKLIGSAQRRWSDVFLQHGSILLRPSKGKDRFASVSLSELLIKNIIPAEDGIQIEGRGVNSSFRGNDAFCSIDIKLIISAIAEVFQESLGINLIHGSLSPFELDLSEKLIKEKYSKDQWNMRI